MRFLAKQADSAIVANGWSYQKQSERPQIREVLLQEQTLEATGEAYCAYTEALFRPVDMAEIEHFDDRLKNSDDDDYWNWYAVHSRINRCKKRIEKFLPILRPYDGSLSGRIVYSDGQFSPVNDDDVEAQNLIDFLGWNDPTLAAFRDKHVSRCQSDREEFFSDDDDGFVAYMRRNPENLSFITVLESELGLPLA